MNKIKVEFINTWPSCDSIGRLVQSSAERYGDKIELKMYRTGKDMDYIKKYGMIYVGTMIINEKTFIKNLNKKCIDKAIDDAINELDT